jgi:nucleotide-binding universal stress UspA family protein
MGKKILVAVDDSLPSARAVKYAARMSSVVREMTYTLFYVEAVIPETLVEEANTDPKAKADVDRLDRLNAESAKRILDNHKELMCREGVPENNIETVAQRKQAGTAKDILNLAQQGLYNAILMGHGDIMRSRDFFMGTTAAKVLEHSLEVPVWVVDEETTSMKVMVAVDGSDNSLRAVDHIISMVGNNPSVKLTLFHVRPHLRHYYSIAFEEKEPALQDALHRGDKRRIECFHEEAFKRLTTGGLQENQIEIRTNTRAYHVSTAILDEARSGLYGTVVIGRRGERQAFFMGSVAMRLVQKISGIALWVVP